MDRIESVSESDVFTNQLQIDIANQIERLESFKDQGAELAKIHDEETKSEDGLSFSEKIDAIRDLYLEGDYDAVCGACCDLIDEGTDHIEIYNLLGASWKNLEQFDLAVQAYELALMVGPNNAVVLSNLGACLSSMERYEDALTCYDQALITDDQQPAFHYNRGNVLKNCGKIREAIDAQWKALSIDPEFVLAWNNIGALLKAEGQHKVASVAFRKAVELEPLNIDARSNLAVCESLIGNNVSASEQTDFLLDLDPTHRQGLLTKAALSTTLQATFAEDVFDSAIDAHPHAPSSYFGKTMASNYFSLARSEVFSYHKAFGDQFSQVAVTPTADQLSLCEDKIRIGYVSPDFNKHSVAYFFEPLISNHNKDKVEVFCYYNNTKVDETTERLQQHADHWRSTVGLNDAQLVELIQNDGIHILVDLAGHTDKNRLTAFAYKPAPIQVTWLGYPNTTGLDAVDYRFTDDIADPIGDSEDFHTEELVRLPDGMWCYSGDNTIKPNEELPYNRNGYITFGSFNNLAKVTPQVVELWANILKAVPKSKLLLKAKQLGEEEAKNRFIALFEEHGVSPDQLELRGSLSLTEKHLDLYGEVDIALDPFPFNGATTTCEALWMGVPVLTLRGDRHVGRVGASLVHRVGLDAFIAETEEDYLNKAIAHASDTKALSALRLDMRQRVQQSPLCDPKLFTKHIENAFSYMWERLDASTK